MNKTLLLLLIASTLPLGCTTMDDGGSASTTSSEGVPSCEIVGSSVSEVQCGSYDEACDHGGDSGTGGCEDEDRQDIVDCIVQAEADGVSFSFGSSHYENGGQYDTRDTYHVEPDGTAWRVYGGFDDLCTTQNEVVYAGVDFGDCVDWDCIESTLAGASSQTCLQEMNCDGI